MFLSAGIWYYLEFIFHFIGFSTTTALLLTRRYGILRGIFWYILYLVAPIVSFGIYMMVGKPLFLRKIPIHRSESVDCTDIGIDGRYQKLLDDVAKAGSYRFSNDSAVEYLPTGSEYYDNLLEDIESARRTIFAEIYLIRRDEVSEMFVDALCRKAEEGLEVKVIFDDFGYDGKDLTYVRRMQKSGAECTIFHNMTKTMFSPVKNYRDHRKLFIIDGRIAYTGGVNIGKEYLDKGRMGKWNDSMIRITGPQSKECQEMFAEDWEYAAKKKFIHNNETCQPSGNVPMVLVPGNTITPEINPISTLFSSMIEHSEEYIFIKTPYLVPTRSLLEGLCSKARKGVDVRIMIPSVRDQIGVFWANRKYASILMEAGARVFECRREFIHNKDWVCDGEMCAVGTANLCLRSFNLNFECVELMFSKPMSQTIRQRFERDQLSCNEYSLEQYNSRTLWQRFLTTCSMVVRSLI